MPILILVDQDQSAWGRNAYTILVENPDHSADLGFGGRKI
jgi:hypothetical protein